MEKRQLLKENQNGSTRSENKSLQDDDWVKLGGREIAKWFKISSLATNPHFSPVVRIEKLSCEEIQKHSKTVMSRESSRRSNVDSVSPLQTMEGFESENSNDRSKESGDTNQNQGVKRKILFSNNGDTTQPPKVAKMLSCSPNMMKKALSVMQRAEQVLGSRKGRDDKLAHALTDLIGKVKQRVPKGIVIPPTPSKSELDQEDEEEEDEAEEEESSDDDDAEEEEEEEEVDEEDGEYEEDEEDSSEEDEEDSEEEDPGEEKGEEKDKSEEKEEESNVEEALVEEGVSLDEIIPPVEIMEDNIEEIITGEDALGSDDENSKQDKTSNRSVSPLDFPDSLAIAAAKKDKVQGKQSAFMSEELDKFLESNQNINQELVPSSVSTLGKPDYDVVDKIAILSFQTRHGLHSHIAAHENHAFRSTAGQISEKTDDKSTTGQMSDKTDDITKIKGWQKKIADGPERSDDRDLAKLRSRYLRACGSEPFFKGITFESHHSSRDSFHFRRMGKVDVQAKERIMYKSLKLVAEKEDQPTKGKIYGWRNDGRFASKRNVKIAMNKDGSEGFARRQGGPGKMTLLSSARQSFSNELAKHMGANAAESHSSVESRKLGYYMKRQTELETVDVSGLLALQAVSAVKQSTEEVQEYMDHMERWCGRTECKRLCICHLIHPAEPISYDDEDVTPADPLACRQPHCALGCVCQSLDDAHNNKKADQHCAEIGCMFECVCKILPRESRSARLRLNPRYGNSVHFDDLLFEQMVQAMEEGTHQEEEEIIDDSESLASSQNFTVPAQEEGDSDQEGMMVDVTKISPVKVERGAKAVMAAEKNKSSKQTRHTAVSMTQQSKRLRFVPASGSSKSTVKRGQPAVTSSNYETVKELWKTIGGKKAGVPLEEADENMLLKLMPMTKRNKQVVAVKGKKKGQLEKKVVHCLHAGHIERFKDPLDNNMDSDIRKLLEDSTYRQDHQHAARTKLYIPLRRELKCQCVRKAPPTPPPTPPLPPPKQTSPAASAAAGGKKFKVQMVLVQRKKVTTPNPDAGIGQTIPHLLEIISNCNWDKHRSDVLSRVSALAGTIAYPKPCAFSLHSLIVNILPAASKPTTIPPHLQNVLKTTSMYPIRVQITPSVTKELSPPKPATAPVPVTVQSMGISGLTNLRVKMKEEVGGVEMSANATKMVLQGAGALSPMSAGSKDTPIKLSDDEEDNGDKEKKNCTETVRVITLSDGRQMVLRGAAGSKIGPQTISALKALAGSKQVPGSPGTKLVLGPNNRLIPEHTLVSTSSTTITGVSPTTVSTTATGSLATSLALARMAPQYKLKKVLPGATKVLSAENVALAQQGKFKAGTYLLPVKKTGAEAPVFMSMNKFPTVVSPKSLVTIQPDGITVTEKSPNEIDVVIKVEKEEDEPKQKIQITEPIEIDEDEEEKKTDDDTNAVGNEPQSDATEAVPTEAPSGIDIEPPVVAPFVIEPDTPEEKADVTPEEKAEVTPEEKADVSPPPPVSAPSLQSAKARLQSVLAATAKKLKPATPPATPPVTSAASSPMLQAGKPMTALALLKARQAGLSVPSMSSSPTSSQPAAATAEQQATPKRRSRKEKLTTRNSAVAPVEASAPKKAPVVDNPATEGSEVLRIKSSIKEEDEEDVDIETVQEEVINIDESDEEDTVEILRVEYGKDQRKMDSSSCDIHAVGLLHGQKNKKRKGMLEPESQARDETMEFREEVLMVEGLNEEDDDDGGRDRETHMCRERARRCDLSFKFEALRKAVLPKDGRSAKIVILQTAIKECRRLTREEKLLETSRKYEVEKRERLIQKFLYLRDSVSGVMETQNTEHCVINETTGSRNVIDDDVAYYPPEDSPTYLSNVKGDSSDDENYGVVIPDSKIGGSRFRGGRKKRGARSEKARRSKQDYQIVRQQEEKRRKEKQQLELLKKRQQQLEELVTSSSVYMDVDGELNESGNNGVFLNDDEFGKLPNVMQDSQSDDAAMLEDSAAAAGFEIKEEITERDKEYGLLTDEALLETLGNSDFDTEPLPPIESMSML